MKIERVRLLRVAIPLRFPFETSFGRWTSREALLVVVEAAGFEGYGEVTAHEEPLYSYETIDTAVLVLTRHLVPALMAEPVANAEELAERLGFVRGHPMARAGLEGAVRDLLAKREGVSLSNQIGGTRAAVETGVSLGIEATPAALVERARPFVERGVHRVKIKIRPGWDLEPLAAMRAAFPDLALAVDANAAYTPADEALLQSLARFSPVMIEQPYAWDDLVDHARLARTTDTPICLDESLTGVAAARAALALAPRWIFNVKLGRVGGTSAARAIHDLAREAGVPVWCGGMLETCIGRLHNLALASLPGFTMPGDLAGTDRYFAIDLVDPPIRARADGFLETPAGAGIGARVLPDVLRRVTSHEEVLGAGAG